MSEEEEEGIVRGRIGGLFGIAARIVEKRERERREREADHNIYCSSYRKEEREERRERQRGSP